jgi:hypothetical protein
MLQKQGPKQSSGVAAILERKLAAYAAAASAAGVATVALSQAAQARIIYTPTQVTIFNSSNYLVLNDQGIANFLLSNQYATFSGGLRRAGTLMVEAIGRKSFVETSASARSVRAAAALYAGDRIPPAGGSHGMKPGGYLLKFWEMDQAAKKDHRNKRLLMDPSAPRPGGGSGYSGKWQNATDRYLGLKFQINGKTHYGWARLSVQGHHCVGLLTGYAYETVPGKAIIAGKTSGPDVVTMAPSTLGKLAMGRR